jgi:putative ABC transport system permease protein
MKTLSRGHLKAGLDSVRNAKLRSFWTMLGVIIGVSSVITVVAIGEGIKHQVEGQIHHFGDNFITVRPEQLTVGSGSSGSSLLPSGFQISKPLAAKDVAIVSATPGLHATAPLTLVPGKLTSENKQYANSYVIGTSPALPSLLNQSLAFGAFFDDQDLGTNVAVLGHDAADRMFDDDVPLGRSFDFHGQTFIVRGIFNKFTNAPLSQQADFNSAVFIPNDVAEALTNETAPTYEILARATQTSAAKDIANGIQKRLDGSHGGDSGFTVLTGDESLEANDSVLTLLTRLIAGVAAISLLVGGIGIMNVMLVSVTERVHEIGIRKAVGATNRQILSQFIVESTLLSLTGGIIGIIIAILIDIGLRVSTSLEPVITWQIVAIATSVSLLVGIIFGTVPAFKAARKDPIDALRAE